MDGIIWAALIVAAALVYLATAIAKRPAPQIVQQPSTVDSGQSTPIVVGAHSSAALPAGLQSPTMPSNSTSELAYAICFDYKDEQVRIVCIPSKDGYGKPNWKYYQWRGGGTYQLSHLLTEEMVIRKSDAEIEVAEREELRRISNSAIPVSY